MDRERYRVGYTSIAPGNKLLTNVAFKIEEALLTTRLAEYLGVWGMWSKMNKLLKLSVFSFIHSFRAACIGKSTKSKR